MQNYATIPYKKLHLEALGVDCRITCARCKQTQPVSLLRWAFIVGRHLGPYCLACCVIEEFKFIANLRMGP